MQILAGVGPDQVTTLTRTYVRDLDPREYLGRKSDTSAVADLL